MIVHPLAKDALSVSQLRPVSDRPQTCINHTSDQHQSGSLILPSRELNGTALPSKRLNYGIALRLSKFNVSALKLRGAQWYCSQLILIVIV
jgi:hypothetical protein